MKRCSILHISNSFPNSSLYKLLAIHLEQLNVQQTVYSAVRTDNEASYNPSELNHLDTYFENILRPYHRIFFRLKVQKIFETIVKRVDLSTTDLVHAHTLYSDGAVALNIKKKTGIPYIVAIRKTGLYVFQKYRPDLRWLRNEILYEAEKIVFISPAHCHKFISLLSGSIKEEVEQKAVIIPNGVDPFFLHSSSLSKHKKENSLKLLYVGDFRKLKNVPTLIRAVKALDIKKTVTLTLVGNGGNGSKEVNRMITSGNFPNVNWLGRIQNRETLCSIYKAHDLFVMISKPETFGLVYLEALSQGLPIIHTKGEGVDGYFKGKNISEMVLNNKDPDEVAAKITVVSERINQDLKKECIQQAKKFSWAKIAEDYKNIYLSALKS